MVHDNGGRIISSIAGVYEFLLSGKSPQNYTNRGKYKTHEIDRRKKMLYGGGKTSLLRIRIIFYLY
jgi:hypothetical protein